MQPIVVLADFGASSSSPSLLSTAGNSLVLFRQPSFVPGVNAGTVTPPSWSPTGTPDRRNYQARVQMLGQLLYAPNTGCLNGKIYKLVAAGTVSAPASASSASFNVVLGQNYLAFNTAPLADRLFALANPVTLAASATINWSLTATLAGNGVGTSVLSCAGALVVAGTKYNGNGFSNNPVPRTEPPIQLSLGLVFGGSAGDGLFEGSCTSFKLIQQCNN